MYIVLILALVASGIFLIQFILSMIGSDIDSGIDVDISDGSGFDFSDIISFKGIVHFLMGSCWTLYALKFITVINIGISIIVGLIFVSVLYRVYKFVNNLKSEPIRETSQDLLGRTGVIYYRIYNSSCYIIQIPVNGVLTERAVVSKSGKTDYLSGDNVTIINVHFDVLYID